MVHKVFCCASLICLLPLTLCLAVSVFFSSAIKFSPIGGRIHVQLSASNFIVNPFAAAANLSLMVGDNKYTMNPYPSPPVTPIMPNRTFETPILIDPQSTPLTTLHVGVNDTSSPANPLPLPLPDVLGTLQVRVSVTDSGPGVPQAEAAHLFQAYMQVSAGKSQQGQGTGLGLSISKSIVELHGGQIGFTSAARPDAETGDVSGSGAEFFFTIPLDVSLVKSRASNAHSSASVSQLGGSYEFSSGSRTSDVGLPGHSHTSMRLDGISSQVTATANSNAHQPITQRNVNFADESINGHALSTMDEEEDEVIRASSTDPILSPHVGLVHRTHTINPAKRDAKELKAQTLGIGLDPSLLSRSSRLRPDSHPRRLVAHKSNRSYSGVDSVVDIAPLAESGIGITGEHETSVTHIRFHSDEDDGEPRFDEYMDPTRGDWDHIEQHTKTNTTTPNTDAIAVTPNDKIDPTSSKLISAQAASPSESLNSTQPIIVNGRPSSSASPSSSSPLIDQSRPHSIDPPAISLHLPPIGPILSAPSTSNSTAAIIIASAIPTYRDTPMTTPTSTLTTPPILTRPPSYSAKPSQSHTGSPDGMVALPSPVNDSLQSRSSDDMRNFKDARQTQPTVTSRQPRATHAIDLASFISEETKAQHKAFSSNSGPSGSWAPAHLSPSPPLSGSQALLESSHSSPSTPQTGPAAPAAVGPPPTQPTKTRTKPAAFKQACRVLVVEDSLPNRKLLVSLLTRLKCIAHGAEDGQQCIDLFRDWMTQTEPENRPAMRAATTQQANNTSINSPRANAQYPFDIILMVSRHARTHYDPHGTIPFFPCC